MSLKVVPKIKNFEFDNIRKRITINIFKMYCLKNCEVSRYHRKTTSYSFLIAKSYENDARKLDIIFEHLIYVHHVTISGTTTFNVVMLIRLTKLPMRRYLEEKLYEMKLN